jgi:hypothetical protein
LQLIKGSIKLIKYSSNWDTFHRTALHNTLQQPQSIVYHCNNKGIADGPPTIYLKAYYDSDSEAIFIGSFLRVLFVFIKLAHSKHFYDVATFLRRERRSEFHGD